MSTTLGNKVLIDIGYDPDIVTDNNNILHIIYVKNTNGIFYTKGTIASGFEIPLQIGLGSDPRICVDTNNTPHIVYGDTYIGGAGTSIYYTKLSGTAFTVPIKLSTGRNRKPRIESDIYGNILVTWEDRTNTIDRIKFIKILQNGTINPIIVVGNDNNGGLAVDNTNNYHFTWRDIDNSITHTKITDLGVISPKEHVLPTASDASDIDINKINNSIYITGVVTNAGGIYYTEYITNTWSPYTISAVSQVNGALPDDVSPSIIVDNLNRKYICFAGNGLIPYYFVIDENNNYSNVIQLDTGTTGGKYMNPNMTKSLSSGVYISYSLNGNIYVNSIGLINTCPQPICTFNII